MISDNTKSMELPKKGQVLFLETKPTEIKTCNVSINVDGVKDLEGEKIEVDRFSWAGAKRVDMSRDKSDVIKKEKRVPQEEIAYLLDMTENFIDNNSETIQRNLVKKEGRPVIVHEEHFVIKRQDNFSIPSEAQNDQEESSLRKIKNELKKMGTLSSGLTESVTETISAEEENQSNDQINKPQSKKKVEIKTSIQNKDSITQKNQKIQSPDSQKIDSVHIFETIDFKNDSNVESKTNAQNFAQIQISSGELLFGNTGSSLNDPMKSKTKNKMISSTGQSRQGNHIEGGDRTSIHGVTDQEKNIIQSIINEKKVHVVKLNTENELDFINLEHKNGDPEKRVKKTDDKVAKISKNESSKEIKEKSKLNKKNNLIEGQVSSDLQMRSSFKIDVDKNIVELIIDSDESHEQRRALAKSHIQKLIKYKMAQYTQIIHFKKIQNNYIQKNKQFEQNESIQKDSKNALIDHTFDTFNPKQLKQSTENKRELMSLNQSKTEPKKDILFSNPTSTLFRSSIGNNSNNNTRNQNPNESDNTKKSLDPYSKNFNDTPTTMNEEPNFVQSKLQHAHEQGLGLVFQSPVNFTKKKSDAVNIITESEVFTEEKPNDQSYKLSNSVFKPKDNQEISNFSNYTKANQNSHFIKKEMENAEFNVVQDDEQNGEKGSIEESDYTVKIRSDIIVRPQNFSMEEMELVDLINLNKQKHLQNGNEQKNVQSAEKIRDSQNYSKTKLSSLKEKEIICNSKENSEKQGIEEVSITENKSKKSQSMNAKSLIEEVNLNQMQSDDITVSNLMNENKNWTMNSKFTQPVFTPKGSEQDIDKLKHNSGNLTTSEVIVTQNVTKNKIIKSTIEYNTKSKQEKESKIEISKPIEQKILKTNHKNEEDKKIKKDNKVKADTKLNQENNLIPRLIDTIQIKNEIRDERFDSSLINSETTPAQNKKFLSENERSLYTENNDSEQFITKYNTQELRQESFENKNKSQIPKSSNNIHQADDTRTRQIIKNFEKKKKSVIKSSHRKHPQNTQKPNPSSNNYKSNKINQYNSNATGDQKQPKHLYHRRQSSHNPNPYTFDCVKSIENTIFSNDKSYGNTNDGLSSTSFNLTKHYESGSRSVSEKKSVVSFVNAKDLEFKNNYSQYRGRELSPLSSLSTRPREKSTPLGTVPKHSRNKSTNLSSNSPSIARKPLYQTRQLAKSQYNRPSQRPKRPDPKIKRGAIRSKSSAPKKPISKYPSKINHKSISKSPSRISRKPISKYSSRMNNKPISKSPSRIYNKPNVDTSSVKSKISSMWRGNRNRGKLKKSNVEIVNKPMSYDHVRSKISLRWNQGASKSPVKKKNFINENKKNIKERSASKKKSTKYQGISRHRKKAKKKANPLMKVVPKMRKEKFSEKKTGNSQKSEIKGTRNNSRNYLRKKSRNMKPKGSEKNYLRKLKKQGYQGHGMDRRKYMEKFSIRKINNGQDAQTSDIKKISDNIDRSRSKRSQKEKWQK